MVKTIKRLGARMIVSQVLATFPFSNALYTADLGLIPSIPYSHPNTECRVRMIRCDPKQATSQENIECIFMIPLEPTSKHVKNKATKIILIFLKCNILFFELLCNLTLSAVLIFCFHSNPVFFTFFMRIPDYFSFQG